MPKFSVLTVLMRYEAIIRRIYSLGCHMLRLLPILTGVSHEKYLV